MNISLVEKNKEKLVFSVKGINAAFANAIRRAIIDEVPTMAIEDVELRKNSSVLYDEMVAHRLGLTPLKTDLKGYELAGAYEATEELSAKQKVSFTLKAKGPGVVTASELQSSDKSVAPVHPNMPITKLTKGQSIELEATAILGRGKNHAKWSPAHVYYYKEPKITVNNDPKLLEEYKESYPAQIFDSNGKIDRAKINTPQLIDACDGISDLVQVERVEDSYIFHVESWGQLNPKDIILEAINQLKGQLDEISTLMK